MQIFFTDLDRREAPGRQYARLHLRHPTLVECISAGITLYPGDVARMEIDGIGVIETPLR